MKKKIVIIGANEFQNPLILKAKELGFETHVFAWKSGDIGEKTADFFYPVSIVEKEEILKICHEINPCGVTSIGSDLATITVNYVARKLGLTCNSPENDYYSTNKYLMRKAMQETGARVPEFTLIDTLESIEAYRNMNYPVIVKPTDRSGSRAVSKVQNYLEFQKAARLAMEESFEKKAICEGLIEGDEYSCECISYEGTHHILAITKKYTTGAPHYIETGHIEPALISRETKEEIQREVFKVLDALHVEYGASHNEFKICDDGKVHIIETGARMGGDCIGSDLVSLSTGYDYMKMVIEIACGYKPDLRQKGENKISFIRFLFNTDDKENIEKYLKQKKVTCIRKMIKYLDNHEVKDSSSRFGYYIMTTDNRTIAEEILEGTT